MQSEEDRYLFGTEEMYGIKRSAEEAQLMDPSAYVPMDHHHHHPHHHSLQHHLQHEQDNNNKAVQPQQQQQTQQQQQGSNSNSAKKTPPPNGKKTKGRVKIKMEFIDNKLRRYTTFSKRKTGIMKKAYELSTLTGTQVMLLVASETGHVYTFATRKLQPMITSEAGKALIQTCLNSPDPPTSGGSQHDQRMSATGFEETELTYTINDDEQKEPLSPKSECSDGPDTPQEDISQGSSGHHLNGMGMSFTPSSGSSSPGTPAHSPGAAHGASHVTTHVATHGAAHGAGHQQHLSLLSLSTVPATSTSNAFPANSTRSRQTGFATILVPGKPASSSESSVTTSVPVSVVPTTQSLLSSGDMIVTSSSGSAIPALVYQKSQGGMVYTTSKTDGLIFNLQAEQSGASSSQHYITIPVPLSSLTATDLSKGRK